MLRRLERPDWAPILHAQLEYSTLISRHRSAVPACSAASATAAIWSVRCCSTSAAAPSVPISPRGRSVELDAADAGGVQCLQRPGRHPGRAGGPRRRATGGRRGRHDQHQRRGGRVQHERLWPVSDQPIGPSRPPWRRSGRSSPRRRVFRPRRAWRWRSRRLSRAATRGTLLHLRTPAALSRPGWPSRSGGQNRGHSSRIMTCSIRPYPLPPYSLSNGNSRKPRIAAPAASRRRDRRCPGFPSGGGCPELVDLLLEEPPDAFSQVVVLLRERNGHSTCSSRAAGRDTAGAAHGGCGVPSGPAVGS